MQPFIGVLRLLPSGVVPGLCLIVAAIALAPTASAHHEAIFGPQSSLLYSSERFVSVQAFTRQLGTSSQRTQETTGVLSGGFNLVKGVPLAFTAILPYSSINELDAGSSTSGFEDSILGLRYRYDLAGLIEKWNREGNFILGMAGVEIPSGVIDHKAWNAPFDYLGGVLGSLERGRWSGIGYAYYRYNALYRSGTNKGNNLFLGGGLAFTPNEDIETGKLISYQLGWSYERYFKDAISGVRDPQTGGEEVLFHPTIVYSPGRGLLFFGLVSIPVWRDFHDTLAQDRFRVGTGVVYSW